jgi:hypothetical protein
MAGQERLGWATLRAVNSLRARAFFYCLYFSGGSIRHASMKAGASFDIQHRVRSLRDAPKGRASRTRSIATANARRLLF